MMESIVNYKKHISMIKQNEILVFQSIENLSEHLYELLRKKTVNSPEGRYVSIALSGGSTPKRIFNDISSRDEGGINWKKIRLFWVDERCVSPDDDESNFKMTQINLLENLDIPDENIFRIFGENDPKKEAIRYSQVLKENLPSENGLPGFDIVLLGIGEDGHTASIFPGNTSLFHSTKYCEAVTHPQSGQQRITITGAVINNADLIIFMVTGADKAKILERIVYDKRKTELPATLVNPTNGNLLWLLDAGAASFLGNHSNKFS